MLSKFRKNNKGFTLIELMVSVSVFAVVMLITTGSILSIFDANRKSQSLRTVMDNLNYSMESLTRSIRFGSEYHCTNDGVNTPPKDCYSGDSFLVLKTSDEKLVRFWLDNGRIARSYTGGITKDYITSPDVRIATMTFRVIGSTPFSLGNFEQPRVIINITGSAGNTNKPSTNSSFTLQTTVSQRLFDSQ